MKKLICLILAVSLLLLFTSCNMGSDSNTSNNKSEGKTATADEGYPYPSKVNWEESQNATGARFNLTLKEYTEQFNKMYNSLGGGSEEIDYSKWQLMKKGQLDENGVAYDYYYYADDKTVLTATVEQQSGKLMNLGCGTTVSVFINESETTYQSVILAMTGIMACVAGGYSVENVTFFADLYVDTISNSNNSFWYNNCIYLLNVEEGETDEDSTMLFRIVAATDNIEDEWQLVNYKTYLQENTQAATSPESKIEISPDVEGAIAQKETDSSEKSETESTTQ